MSYEIRVGELSCAGPGKPAHMLRWSEWGDEHNPQLLICAHGLSRNGRDFDFLAQRLAGRYRVICPDYPGRGTSDWLPDHGDYHNQLYIEDSLQLINTLPHDTLDWIGTSMGGLIGMGIAAMPSSPIRRLVINDVGPFIPGDALALIKHYLKVHPRFADLNEAERHFREVYASFGPLEDQHYRHLVDTGVRADGDGYVLNYDPAIIDTFVETEDADIDIWPVWHAIDCPTLIIRGENSGLLLSNTVEEMKQARNNVSSLEFSRCAHAPSLMLEEQIDVIDRWLDT